MIPGLGTRILHAKRHGQTKTKQNKQAIYVIVKRKTTLMRINIGRDTTEKQLVSWRTRLKNSLRIKDGRIKKLKTEKKSQKR